MELKEAINASQNWSARGFDDTDTCVVSLAYYGDQLLWLKGFGGNWSKDWAPVEDEDYKLLDPLNFIPSGPKPEEQIEQEVLDAITSMHQDDFDDFEPMGEF